MPTSNRRWAATAMVAAFVCAIDLARGAVTVPVPIVFVSRQIPAKGSVYWDATGDMPGVGPWSRFRPAAPGRLLVLEPSGAVRVLIDGAAPSPATLDLTDVNAPNVSYDGATVVFAGLPKGTYEQTSVTNPGAWRLYTIRVDGSALRQLTSSTLDFDTSQFGPLGRFLAPYDDTDPAWLPDGRVVFSSTRWPAFAQYSAVRASNLHVINADGSGEHRITSERNGADRPLVDPITGKIVFARWWRNHRFATNDMSDVADPKGGYVQRDGLTVNRSDHVGGPDALWRNAWHAASINPDGTELTMWGGAFRAEVDNHIYGGSFSLSGELFANFFPMQNMSEAAGFGGIRRYRPGPGSYLPVTGVTSMTLDYVSRSNPTSYGIFRGSYASDPAVLPDGRLIVSWAADVRQDYGLYVVSPDGSDPVRLLDLPGTTELRAAVIASRARPPLIEDRVTVGASALPPTSAPTTFAQDGTFLFDALNVYANAPVDVDVVSAPPVGSAATIRFFLDHQRTSIGSQPNQDWPILLGTSPVATSGSVQRRLPANLPLFEQLRAPNGSVPLTEGLFRSDGAAHVAGMNYGPPGSISRCLGCHAGHSMIPVPTNAEAARWSNLAPGASITVSSTRDANQNRGLTDRRVMKGDTFRYWSSAPGQASNQWVQLTFPVLVRVRSVRLYNPRPDPESGTDLAVLSTRVTLLRDAEGASIVAASASGPLAVTGTDVAFPDVIARVVRINIDQVRGAFEGAAAAGLAEIEVIASGVSNDPSASPVTGIRFAGSPSR
jgi:hypothetical protein